MEVSLDGLVTRGNGMSNSIGFLYQGHILTCTPQEGNIIKHKNRLFLPAKIIGTISRYNTKTKKDDDPRPKIIFNNLLPITPPNQGELFTDIP
jgi:hypothetical protein